MNSQTNWPLSPADHLYRASERVSRAIQRCLSFLRSNRHYHAVVHALILLLRFGQVAATAILTLVFTYMIYEHYTHWCRWYPSQYSCRNKYLSGEDPGKVPWSYWVVIAAASASFFQLYLLALIRLYLASSSRDSLSSSRHLSRALSPLLSRTDILILLLYVFAFASLSDYVVPSRILRGARSGTGCYLDNHFNPYEDVLKRECVLAQHGYWWCMGAMLAYLVTSIAGSLVWVEDIVRRESEKKRKTITGKTPGPIALGEGEGDTMSLRETEAIEEVPAEVEGGERE